MYKEVEINTPLELARYLINEGDLYTKSKSRLYAECLGDGKSPFRVEYANGNKDSIEGLWLTSGNTYYKKIEWYNCIPEGKYLVSSQGDIASLLDSRGRQRAGVRHYHWMCALYQTSKDNPEL